MSRDTAAPQSGDVEHFIVQPHAFRAACELLGQLPYAQVHPVMRALDAGTEAVTVDQHIREINAAEKRLHDLADVARDVVIKLEDAVAMLKRSGVHDIPVTPISIAVAAAARALSLAIDRSTLATKPEEKQNAADQPA